MTIPPPPTYPKCQKCGRAKAPVPDGAAECLLCRIERGEQAPKRSAIPLAHDHWARIHAASDTFAGRYKHVPGIGWRRWDGISWADGTNEVQREHFDAVESGYKMIPKMPEELREKMVGALIRAANVPYAENVLKAMASMPLFHADPSAFDSDTSLVVTPAGVIDTASMSVLPHDSSRLVMCCTRGSWRPEAEDGTRWAKFIQQCFPDADMHDFMRRLLGYIVFGHRNEHIFPIFCGEGGNGKSVMIDTLVYAMGDYGGTAPSELLLWAKNDRHPEEKMVLYGKRLVAASELPEGRRLNEALVKQITGSGVMSAREMYSKRIEFSRTWVPTLDTNHLPLINGTEDAIWDRLLKIQFDQKFRGTPREEKGLTERLQRQPDDVISWCAAGWRDYQKRGLDVPATVKSATSKYRSDSDTLSAWLAETREAGFKSELLKQARERYQGYSGLNRLTSQRFREMLEAKGVQVEPGAHNQNTVWY